jgi:hypothetical protein
MRQYSKISSATNGKGFISFKAARKNISEHLAYSEIWDSHGDEYEDYSLLGCDAV